MSPSFKLTTALILQKTLSIPDLVYILFFFPHCTCWLNEGKFKFNPEIKAQSTLATPEKWATFSLWKRINCFPFTLHRRNIKNETINGPDCVCRGLGQGNHLIITSSSIFGMLRLRVFSNSSGSQEHFRKAPFSRQISVEMSCVFKYHRSSVNAALKIRVIKNNLLGLLSYSYLFLYFLSCHASCKY